MRARPIASLVALLLLTAARDSCRATTAPGTMGDIAFTARISRDVIHVGESATLELRLHNAGSGAVTLQFSNGCQIVPFIADVSGAIVFPDGGGWMCAQLITELRLAAGETVVRTTEIRAGAPQPAVHTGAQLPPGRYRAWGTVGVPPWVQATSNAVELTVVQ